MAMAIPDLAVIALCLVTLALILAALGLSRAIAGAFDIHIPGLGHPFSGVSSALHNSIISWLESALKGVEKVTARFFNDLLGSLELLGALTLLLGEGVKVALEYLWTHSLPAYVLHEIELGVKRLTPSRVDVAGLEAKVKADVTAAMRAEVATIRADANAAKAAALAASAAAGVAAEKAAHSVVNEITQVVQHPISYVTDTVTEVVPGLADALTHAGAEVAELPGLALPDLRGILNNQDLATLGGLMAAIPLLRAITSTLAVETGLENEACRSKVKGICGTDPSAWTALLEGLAVLGFGFSLRELYTVAERLVGDLSGVIREAA
jgi:hypothetical protein